MLYYDIDPLSLSSTQTIDAGLIAISDIIREGLLRDGYVRLHQFGTFRLTWTKPHRIKHPATGEYMTIPTTARVTFKAAKLLREQIEPAPKPLIVEQRALQDAQISETIRKRWPLTQDSDTLISAESENTDHRISKRRDAKTVVEDKTPSNRNSVIALAGAAAAIAILLQAQINEPLQPATAIQPTLTLQDDHPSLSSQDKESVRLSHNQNIPGETDQNRLNITASTELTHSDSDSNASATAIYGNQRHKVKFGENLWQLAQAYYGDARLWPNIYRENSDQLKNPDELEVGKSLTIPKLQQSPTHLSDADRENVADGYLLIYESLKQNNQEKAFYFLIGASQYQFDWLTTQKKRIYRKDWKRLLQETAS